MGELPGWLKLPSLLGLDAALVAVVWQRAASARLGVSIEAVATLGLGLVVWGIYLVDRIADGVRGAGGTERHEFAFRHRRALQVLALGCWVGAAALSTRLPDELWWPGAGLASIVVGYLFVVHRLGPRFAQVGGGKEGAVGLCFGFGTMLPVVAACGAAGAWVALGFAVACWCNCLLIEAWEGRTRVRRGEVRAMAVAFGVSVINMPPSLAVAIGSLFGLLWALDRLGAADARAARVVVDLAMAGVGAAWWVLA